jgi:hypothetical protein
MAVPNTFPTRISEAVKPATPAQQAAVASAFTTFYDGLAGSLDYYAGADSLFVKRLKAHLEGELEDFCREFSSNIT